MTICFAFLEVGQVCFLTVITSHLLETYPTKFVWLKRQSRDSLFFDVIVFPISCSCKISIKLKNLFKTNKPKNQNEEGQQNYLSAEGLCHHPREPGFHLTCQPPQNNRLFHAATEMFKEIKKTKLFQIFLLF